MKRVCVVGSGPAGLFLTRHLIRQLREEVKIDILEKLPAPFGLLKFGVAPDQNHIKEKFIKHFDSLFSKPNVSIYGNVSVGFDVTVKDLCQFYDAVILCSGMGTSKRHFSKEPNTFGADQIVAWYNNRPKHCAPLINFGELRNLVIVGNGNVALDVARMFLLPATELRNSDANPAALKAFASIKDLQVTILGRRGPAEASFTPAELRLFSKMKEAPKVSVHPSSATSLYVDSLGIIQMKLLKILDQLCAKVSASNNNSLDFRFFSTASRLIGNNLMIKENDAVERIIPCDVLVESIGFHQMEKIWPEHQNSTGAFIAPEYKIVDNVFACGWARTGPKGTVADTLIEAENCASAVLAHLAASPNGGANTDLIISGLLRNSKMTVIK